MSLFSMFWMGFLRYAGPGLNMQLLVLSPLSRYNESIKQEGKGVANTEHLAVIQQGPAAWNTWRKLHPEIRLDLSGANLAGANLSGASLSYAYVSGERLNADLSNVYLSSADLRRADLSGADLSGANLSGGDLIEVNFSGANLRRADLSGANLTGANLSGADLSEANLVEVDFVAVDLTRAVFTDAVIGWTIFADVDVRTIQGLETVLHQAPSTIGTDTVARSQGHIPESFLRGVGLPDPFIAFVLELMRSSMAHAPCFLRYSPEDQDFVEQLSTDLQRAGIRCWLVPEEMHVGKKMRSRIDNATRLFDRLLLVLSEHSIESAWVEKEVETAIDREARTGTPVLFPVYLDEAVMQTEQARAVALRSRRTIGDFRYWKQPDLYHRAFTRLLLDLKSAEEHGYTTFR